MHLQLLTLCPRSWRLLLLMREYNIEFLAQISDLTTDLKYPTVEGYDSDTSYILTNINNFLLTPSEINLYGYWVNVIEIDFIPSIVMPIRFERAVKPVMLRMPPDVRRLSKKRQDLHAKLYELEEWLCNHAWLLGARFTIADLSLAASIAVLEYMGEISLDDTLQYLKAWYTNLKSRQSFDIVLSQKCPGLEAHKDFIRLPC
jgi:hypothetical protein